MYSVPIVYRSEPSQQDLEMLASSFLSFNLDSHINTQQAQCIKACCTAYAQLTTNQELNFGRRSGSSRDLHHFFKYLARRHRCSQTYFIQPVASDAHTSMTQLEYLICCSHCTAMPELCNACPVSYTPQSGLHLAGSLQIVLPCFGTGRKSIYMKRDHLPFLL